MSRVSLTPVILCGGSGTRLWPRSRPATPKPFLPLVADGTLFQEALRRTSDEALFDQPIVVTGAAHLSLVEEQARDFRLAEVIIEPEPRQTAAAVALAALRVPEETVMLVCPSDHHIADVKRFIEAARNAANLATEGWLVCFGIEARTPETRFGYLRRGEPLEPHGFRVLEFVEKPDRARAVAYVLSGEFAWNGGIFAFRAGDYLEELDKYRPKLSDAVRKAHANGSQQQGCFYPDTESFLEIQAESIDYAVMENTDRAAMVDAQVGWSDIGNWSALYAARPHDEFGNSLRGPVRIVDCRNVMVDSDGLRVSLVGVEDLIVVVDGQDVMITSSASAHEVGKLATVQTG